MGEVERCRRRGRRSEAPLPSRTSAPLPHPNVRPWLCRVVVNACYSKLRHEIPHRDRRTGDEPLAQLPGPGVDPAEGAVRDETTDVVMGALARLPVSLRVPVVLRYYADLSERDIARAIGRRQGTVKSRLHEARRRLAADPDLSALVDPGVDAGRALLEEVEA